MSNAGKREMGPKCGSLPLNAGELAGVRIAGIRDIRITGIRDSSGCLTGHVDCCVVFEQFETWCQELVNCKL